jgi:hypothetical protein
MESLCLTVIKACDIALILGDQEELLQIINNPGLMSHLKFWVLRGELSQLTRQHCLKERNNWIGGHLKSRCFGES